MRYVVSGYRRCGTGMMVRVLLHALPGRNVVCQPEKDKFLNKSINGYQPSPSGLYEVSPKHYMDPRYICKYLKDEHIIKVFFDGLPTLPVFKEEYAVIFMLRNPDEIEKSLDLVKHYHAQINKPETTITDHPLDVYKPYDQTLINLVLDIVDVRSDMRLHLVHYEQFVENPLSELQKLVTLGLPLSNLEKAAEVVNPEFRRARCG